MQNTNSTMSIPSTVGFFLNLFCIIKNNKVLLFASQKEQTGKFSSLKPNFGSGEGLIGAHDSLKNVEIQSYIAGNSIFGFIDKTKFITT